MAMTSYGTITFLQLQTEFGGSNPISINEYYRGGGLVPDIAANAAVPTSGAIDLQDFYGAVNRTFGTAIGDLNQDSAFIASVSFTLATNGSTPPWTVPTTTGIGSGYEARLALNSGDTPTGPTLGSFHRLDTARTWTLDNNVYDTTKTCNVTLTIRVYPGGATVSTETFNMTATVLP